MVRSVLVSIWTLVAALALLAGSRAWAQNDPVLAGSSSASSSSAVSSLTLTAPSGLFPGDLMLANLSQSYGSGPTSVSLTSVANVAPYSVIGLIPYDSGVDGNGYAFASNLVGTSLAWNGASFTLCGSWSFCAVTSGVTVTLTAGSYTTLNILATGVNGGVAGAVFTVTYTDGSTSTFTQSVSDWGNPESYSGESIASSTSYRITPFAGTQTNPVNSATGWNIYGYTFALNSAKTVKSLTVPNTRNVVVLAVSLSTTSTGATAPSGWTQLKSASTGAVSQSVWYRIATAADIPGSTTYAFSFPSSGRAAGSIMAFGGVATSSPAITVSSQVNGPASSYTAPAISFTATQTWVGLYTIANGTTSGSDFQSPNPDNATTAIDVGTGSGSSGVLIGGFDAPLAAYCSSSSCQSSVLVEVSSAGTSAASIGTSIVLSGALPSPTAQWHFDEGSWSGTAGEVTDSSGNGYNGVAVGGATTSGTSPALTGSPGTCYYGSFNGSSQYVQLPSSVPHISANSTITAWIRPTAATTAGRIYWDDYNLNGVALSYGDPGSNKLRVYVRSPTTNYVNSAYSLSLNTWYFVVADFQTSGGSYYLYLYIYSESGTLLDSESVSGSGTWSASTGAYSVIGGDATGSAEGAVDRFPGNIDEVTIYDTGLTTTQLAALATATHTCALSTPNHYAVSAASSAVNCQATPVTVTAHSSTHTPVVTNDTIILGTSTGHGDWTLTTGNGSFVAGSSNSGSATYQYAQSDAGVAVFSLRDTYAETVTINVTDGAITATSGTATAAEDSPITFAPSGFIITNGANTATNIATQAAGVTSTQSLALQAVRTDTKTGACTAVFASGTTVNVGLAFQCNNPTSCVGGQTFSVTNNGTTTALASNSSAGVTSYTTVPLKFSTVNAEAPISLTYSDVGQVTLAAKYSIPLGSGTASANTMLGASQFVVQPYGFKLSSIVRSSDSFANPGASSASGTAFIAAGAAFSATVTAVNYGGSATPNFGHEITPATVSLTPSLVLPASGDDPAVSGSFGSFSSGVATGTAFSWPEVGIITLTPSTSNYLSTGTVTGTASGNVGRFIPYTFSTSVNSPIFATACQAGAFTYVGQPFTYSVAPVLTVTPQALGGANTKNYTGSLFRLTNASLTGRTYTPTPASPALVLTGLPATSSDPAIADLGTGVGTLTFSAGSGLSFSHGTTASPPFSANIALSINVIDLDGATASNPVSFGSGSGIPFNDGASQYYGRLALRDALGSELIDLPMQLTTQYYVSAAQGFTTNLADTCSAAPGISFSNYQLNLKSGGTCVRDSGSPGVSGAGCPAAASSSIAFYPVSSSGNFNLVLAAPGSGNNGAVTVTATTPAWLQYLWNTGSGIAAGPSGLATFGVFPGPASRIYQREVY